MTTPDDQSGDQSGEAVQDQPPPGAIALGHDTFYTRVARDGEWIGIHEWHRERGEYTAGFVAFTGRTRPEWWSPTAPTWEVVSEDPLTLSPSLACSTCGHHGFIREGQWMPV